MSADPKLVVFDTDPGIDDTMALAFLARRPEARIAAITTVFGNLDVETTTRNALLLRAALGLGDVPLAKGAAAPLHGAFGGGVPYVHGDDALGGVAAKLAERGDPGSVDPRPAHQVIIDLARANPGKIHICAVGPLTNLARALAEAPELPTLLAGVSVMGGAFGTNGRRGNVTPVAEANILSDPDAADLCATVPWPIRFIGLDVTEELVMEEAYLADIAAKGGADGQLIWDVSRFYQAFTHRTRGISGVFAHDTLAVMHVLAPDLFTMRSGPVRVVTNGIARGESIQRPDANSYPPNEWDDFPSQQVAIGMDVPRALAMFAETAFR